MVGAQKNVFERPVEVTAQSNTSSQLLIACPMMHSQDSDNSRDACVTAMKMQLREATVVVFKTPSSLTSGTGNTVRHSASP